MSEVYTKIGKWMRANPRHNWSGRRTQDAWCCQCGAKCTDDAQYCPNPRCAADAADVAQRVREEEDDEIADRMAS